MTRTYEQWVAHYEALFAGFTDSTLLAYRAIFGGDSEDPDESPRLLAAWSAVKQELAERGLD